MRDGTLRKILLAGFAGVLVLLAVVFALLPGFQTPKLSLLEPRVVETPTPDLEEYSIEAQTAPPSGMRTASTPAPVYPKTAVNLLVDGVPLFALDSRETVELLIRAYLERCAYEGVAENSILLKASVAAELSTAPADGSVEYLSYDAALQKLLKNRSFVSVQRTVERADVAVDAVETRRENTSALPEGARMFRRLGAGARTLTLSEILYKDGIACSDTETLKRQILGGAEESVLIGTYRSAQPDREPGTTEGPHGKDKGELSFVYPVKGKITSCFGMRKGKMHYGIDLSAAAGTRIVAPESGTVIFCGERAGYGFVIEIRHENGFVSRIASCADVQVELEQHVTRGTPIATLSAGESAKSPILHYELLIDGIPYNPLYYL